MGARKKLTIIQLRRQHCYEAYRKGEIGQKEYLVRIYPLDIMIERLEISVLLQYLSPPPQERKR